jgi:hypothetical protein
MESTLRPDYWLTAYEDRGCDVATQFLRHKTGNNTKQSKCTECPFIRCLAEIPSSEKVLLKNTPKIRSLYKCLDSGMPMDQIVKVFDMSKATLIYWKRNREKIEEKLIKLEVLLTTEEKIERECSPNVPNFGNGIQPVRRQCRTNPAQAIFPIS